MKSIKWLLAIVSFACCASASSARGASDNAMISGAEAAFAACRDVEGVRVVQDGNVVCLRGTIDPVMFVRLMQVRDLVKRHPYAVVSGPGGLVDSSIYIARALDAYDPIPVVGDMCASSCAQFLFLMGHQRVLLPCANVVFHGGPGTVESDLASGLSDKAKQTMISTTWRFTRFYEDRGISLDMVTKPPAHVQAKLDSGKVVFWPWTINQLRAFGVQGIVSENDPDRTVPPDFQDVCVRHRR